MIWQMQNRNALSRIQRDELVEGAIKLYATRVTGAKVTGAKVTGAKVTGAKHCDNHQNGSDLLLKKLEVIRPKLSIPHQAQRERRCRGSSNF